MKNLMLHTGPLVEPLLVDQVKNYLRIDHAHDDVFIRSCIVAARQTCESYTRRSLIQQTWQLYLDAWVEPAITLPRPPLIEIISIKVHASHDDEVVIDPGQYEVNTAAAPGVIRRTGHLAWPRPGRRTAGIEITYTAGYGTSWNDVPEALRLGMLDVISSFYENRGTGFSASLPQKAAALWHPYRIYML